MSLPEESVAANTLPEVTTIPTGKKLIFTDPDTNEGGIITLENLSKQILQNLTSQTFALDQGNLTLLQALNQLNSNKVSYVKYEIINPEKGFSLTLDDASIYLICCVGIDADNVRNIGFSVVVSRSSSNTKGGILNIKTEIPQATLSLEKNVLKCTSTVWARIYVIKL